MVKNPEDLIVPTLSTAIEISAFGKDDYLIKHNTLNHQVKVSWATMEMLNLVNGDRTIGEITEALSTKLNTRISSSTVYDRLYKGNLADYGIIEAYRKIKPKKGDKYILAKFIDFKPHRIAWLTKFLSYLFQSYSMLSKWITNASNRNNNETGFN